MMDLVNDPKGFDNIKYISDECKYSIEQLKKENC